MATTSDPAPWKSINATRGVSKAVTLDGIYRPINSSIIEGLKCRCDENGVIQSIDDIMAGDRVKIEGPFVDFICNVDEIEDSQRVWVLINILQQQVKAKVSTENLSKIG